MQMVIKNENKESVYELVYDQNTIKNLINTIIQNCSIRKRGKQFIEARSIEGIQNIINSTVDFNGNKIYENVKDITEEPINDPDDYWRYGDPAPYSFICDKLLSPELVNFLLNLISEKDIDYNWFTSRKELSKKEDLELEIQNLDSQINEISNYETTRKIDKLQELKRKMKELQNIPQFNYDLLSKYYDEAENSIKLELIQETIKFQKKLK